MLAEITSFGGLWKEKKPMRLAVEEKPSVLVQIKTKQRDNRQKIAEVNALTGKETGKQIDNPRYGKFYYETGETVEVFETNPKEIHEIVLRALTAASNNKK